MPSLTIRRGPDAGKVYELDKAVITIGRSSENDIVVNDTDVSRQHCQLLRKESDYEIRDLDSTNGTFIDGQRVFANRLIQDGQRIELGETITLEYDQNSASEPRADHKIIPIEMSTRFALAVEIGPIPRRFYSLDADTISIGRDLSNQIVVQDPEVSRWHLQLVRGPGDGYTLKDLGSTNGTMVNGAPVVDSKVLTVFDVIELGTAVRLFYIQDTEEARRRISKDTAPAEPLTDAKLSKIRDAGTKGEVCPAAQDIQAGNRPATGRASQPRDYRLRAQRLGTGRRAADAGPARRRDQGLGRSIPGPGRRRLANGHRTGASGMRTDAADYVARRARIPATCGWPTATSSTARRSSCRWLIRRSKLCPPNSSAWKACPMIPETPNAASSA